MATATTARAVVSMGQGTVEIEGSEDFVAHQLARLQMEFRGEPRQDGIFVERLISDAAAPARRKKTAIAKYAKLYGIGADGAIELLRDLPGSSMKHKTVSAALLVSYANSLLGVEHTPLEDIRKACKEHACHDTNNFSATLKRETELFEHSGRTYITLSEGGRSLARSLAEKLSG
ncbi:MAG TPA: hypothetical protein VIF60_00670 [Burkholderiaceae bacterium]|jgi:hypothetical protein